MPTLYVVATPIGNLEDITLRALRILAEVDIIAAEDTRKTKRLLAKYGINTKLTSYHQHSKVGKTSHLLKELDKKDVALVSEAGVPTISDPGGGLVRAAIEEGIPVVAVPGPSAVATALAISGMGADRFLFLGFLPRKKGERQRLLASIAGELLTIVAFESPHRLCSALADILEALGDRQITIGRELTKLHEEVFRGTISGAMEHFAKPRGEFTLVIEGTMRKRNAALPGGGA